MLFFVGLLGAFCLATTVEGVGFGLECTSASPCDSDKGFECRKSISVCTKTICLCAAGKTYIGGTSQCEIDDSKAKIGDACFAITVVPNAECVGSPKKVACKTGFTNMGNVLCKATTVKLIGEACDSLTDTCYAYTADVLVPTPRTCTRKICDCRETELIDGTNCKSRSVNDRCSNSDQCPGNLQCVDGRCDCLVKSERFGIGCFKTTEYGIKVAGATCTLASECGKGMSCSTCLTETDKRCVAGTDVSPVADDCKAEGGAFRPGQTSLTVYLGAVVISLVLKFW